MATFPFDDTEQLVWGGVSMLFAILVGFLGMSLSTTNTAAVEEPSAASGESTAESIAKAAAEEIDEPHPKGLSLNYLDTFSGILDTISSREYILNVSPEEDKEQLVLYYDSALRCLYSFMKTNQHPNTDDLNHVCAVLSSQDDHPDIERALHWLMVARSVWRFTPHLSMVPWVPSPTSSKNEKEREERM